MKISEKEMLDLHREFELSVEWHDLLDEQSLELHFDPIVRARIVVHWDSQLMVHLAKYAKNKRFDEIDVKQKKIYIKSNVFVQPNTEWYIDIFQKYFIDFRSFGNN